MSDVTRILQSIEEGDPKAAEELLPLVYDELRKLAAIKMADENPGQTLQATALVHDAYLRLVDVERVQNWNGRGHFFGAAAEAMRRILVERARRKGRLKRGGQSKRLDLEQADVATTVDADDLIALNDALERLERDDAIAAELCKLRVFAGLSLQEAAEAAGIPRSSAYRHWTYARAFLHCLLSGDTRFTEISDSR
jgi:RNA polymerase sigma factor (TIGR02999 family)